MPETRWMHDLKDVLDACTDPVYCLKSDIPVEDNWNFSFNEIRVGRWINGKPLYRKCFSKEAVGTQLSGDFVPNFIPFTGTNVDTVCRMYGMNSAIGGTIDGDLYTFYIQHKNSFMSQTFRCSTQTDSELVGIHIVDIDTDPPSDDCDWGPWGTINIVVEYTKTTDALNTVPDGSNFSTNDILIGYKDGKKVYSVVVPFSEVETTYPKTNSGI